MTQQGTGKGFDASLAIHRSTTPHSALTPYRDIRVRDRGSRDNFPARYGIDVCARNAAGPNVPYASRHFAPRRDNFRATLLDHLRLNRLLPCKPPHIDSKRSSRRVFASYRGSIRSRFSEPLHFRSSIPVVGRSTQKLFLRKKRCKVQPDELSPSVGASRTMAKKALLVFQRYWLKEPGQSETFRSKSVLYSYRSPPRPPTMWVGAASKVF